MASGSDDSTAGCAGCLGLLAAIAAVLALGALVDPFGWMPPIDEVWADCEADDAPASCDDDVRESMFWFALVNVLYVGGSLAVLFVIAEGGEKLRETRRARFDDAAAVAAYRIAKLRFAWLVVGGLAVAAVPILVAVGS